jgi:hypothetical protein
MCWIELDDEGKPDRALQKCGRKKTRTSRAFSKSNNEKDPD